MPDVRAGALRFTYIHESNEDAKEAVMYTMTEIELSRQHRKDVAQQVESNRLARQLRAARSGMSAGTGNALLGRVFARSHERDRRRNAEVGAKQDRSTLGWSEKETLYRD